MYEFIEYPWQANEKRLPCILLNKKSKDQDFFSIQHALKSENNLKNFLLSITKKKKKRNKINYLYLYRISKFF